MTQTELLDAIYSEMAEFGFLTRYILSLIHICGKGKLLWIINKLMPDRYTRFIDVFGGSGTVTMCRPIQRGCMEVYNDFNGNLTNLFCCVKNRPMALLAELGFLPLNTRDDFNVLYKFFSKGEFTDDYLQEEMDLTEVYLKPPDAEVIRALMLERAPRGSIRRAADFFKLIRYSFSGGAKSFGGKPCDIRRFFHLIDVYKRQALPSSPWRCVTGSSGAWRNAASPGNCRTQKWIPVSYTHLDVYKRQDLSQL